jgi:hypothetical protein
MTYISMENCFIKVKSLKYNEIWKNAQEKIYDICLRFWSKYPSLRNPPMGLITLQWESFPGDRYFDLNRNLWHEKFKIYIDII